MPTKTEEKSAAPVTETPPPEEKLVRDTGKAPPKKGLCRRCGQNKPINRLMLCYPCWVKTENEKKGWREGQPHPEGCGCSLDCRFDKGIEDN